MCNVELSLSRGKKRKEKKRKEKKKKKRKRKKKRKERKKKKKTQFLKTYFCRKKRTAVFPFKKRTKYDKNVLVGRSAYIKRNEVMFCCHTNYYMGRLYKAMVSWSDLLFLLEIDRKIVMCRTGRREMLRAMHYSFVYFIMKWHFPLRQPSWIYCFIV